MVRPMNAVQFLGDNALLCASDFAWGGQILCPDLFVGRWWEECSLKHTFYCLNVVGCYCFGFSSEFCRYLEIKQTDPGSLSSFVKKEQCVKLNYGAAVSYWASNWIKNWQMGKIKEERVAVLSTPMSFTESLIFWEWKSQNSRRSIWMVAEERVLS